MKGISESTESMTLRDRFEMVKSILLEFFREKSLMHGASLAYYAILALVPMLYLSITIFGKVVGHDTMLSIISGVLQEQIGIQNVDGVVDFLDTLDLGKGGNVMLQIVGSVALLFTCTAILNSMKRSINEFYDIQKEKIGTRRFILRTVLFRLVSMAFIVGITTLIVVVYFAELMVISFGNDVFSDNPTVNWVFTNFGKHGIPILSNWIIFYFIFKYVHDGRVNWRIAVRGALLTSLLLFGGQILIKFYLKNYFFGSGAGVAGTFLVILVWVYYTSQIIFLGAKYIAVRSRYAGAPVEFRD